LQLASKGLAMSELPFIHDDFLLATPEARRLYHEYAAPMPIIDYHCHLPPEEVACDKRWDNLTQVWLAGDHYKWRAMRTNGVAERLCTGDAGDREKFDAFAATMPYLLRNPMYHWSHLELTRYFGVDALLSPATADAVWEATQAKLSEPGMSARGLMRASDVRLVCTTDDPCDSLEHHLSVAADTTFDVKMLPTWRPDKALRVDDPEFFNGWVDRLSEAAGCVVADFSDFMSALQVRHDVFHEVGCRLSDYGVETVYGAACGMDEAAAIFARVRAGDVVGADDVLKFRSVLMHECIAMDASSDWTCQIHYGALRNNNRRMFDSVGADTGFDSVGDWPVAEALSRLLDGLAQVDKLPRTILYTLNPRDNEVLATMIGNFQGGGVAGRIQFGSGWWFNDQKDGMERHLEAVSQLSLLSRFVGMLTDSRSFLSYTRHEYFRRILCNMLGRDMAAGLVPGDFDLVGRMVSDISYRNAASYFGFGLGDGALTRP
jgi:glucuronate isomerase